MLDAGKINIILDGQFGSTGKGLLAAYLATESPADFYVSNLSPNAGHTFPMNGEHVVTKQIPVGGILHDRSTIYLSAGSIIDPAKLADEVRRFGVEKDRLYIHPRAAIIDGDDIAGEQDTKSSVAKIASTQSGVGAALARKVMRSASLAESNDMLREIANVQELNLGEYLEWGLTVAMETSQGFDLSINSGLSYPHCTSREITVQEALSSAQVHPRYLGKVALTLRAHPIRVGHLYDDEGQIIGNSGPFYPDSSELTWEDIGVAPEKTTVTGRVRRVASFSIDQYKRALDAIHPDIVFLNFANYLRDEDLEVLNLASTVRRPDLIGVGRELSDILKLHAEEPLPDLLNLIAGENQRRRSNLHPRNIL